MQSRPRQTVARLYAAARGASVGACVLDGEGNVHSGCNVESASYGLTQCAERNALVITCLSESDYSSWRLAELLPHPFELSYSTREENK